MGNIWQIIKGTELEKPLKDIERELTEVSFKTWFEPILSMSRDGNVLEIVVENKFTKTIIKGRYSKLLLSVYSTIGINKIRVVCKNTNETCHKSDHVVSNKSNMTSEEILLEILNELREIKKQLKENNKPDIFKRITDEEVTEILETEKPLGKFYTIEEKFNTDYTIKRLYIGIDNSTGDVWVEEFKTKEECMDWLSGIDLY